MLTAGDVLEETAGIGQHRLTAEEAVAGRGERGRREPNLVPKASADAASPNSRTRSPREQSGVDEQCIFPVARTTAGRHGGHSSRSTRRFYEVVIDAGDGAVLYRESEPPGGKAGVDGEPAQRRPGTGGFPDAWLAAPGDRTMGNYADAYWTRTQQRSGRQFHRHRPSRRARLEHGAELRFSRRRGNYEEGPAPDAGGLGSQPLPHVNRAHDYFYGLGFDEAPELPERQLQQRGTGRDAVLVEAQDSQFTNNAAMQIVPDAGPRACRWASRSWEPPATAPTIATWLSTEPSLSRVHHG